MHKILLFKVTSGLVARVSAGTNARLLKLSTHVPYLLKWLCWSCMDAAYWDDIWR